jgi:hypothetical protein
MPSPNHYHQGPQSPSPSPSPSAASLLQLRDSPSPSPASQSPSQIPWFVPGPSSRFNQRERSRPVHTRHQSTYTPRGPVLSTEARAHQRAQSYTGKSLFGVPSPIAPGGSNDCGRSPLGRLASFPGDTDIPNPMSQSTVSYDGPPRTPAKTTMHRRHSSTIQDSPFSDYFTDDARSLESQTTPTSETQHLLVRLNKLQSQLMRGDNAPEMLNIVGRRVDEIESEVERLPSHDCFPEEMEEEMEEQFFTERERDVLLSSRPGSKRQPNRPNPLGIDGVPQIDEDEINWDKERQEKLLTEAQTALHFLTEAQEQLRQRHQELVNLNEEHSLDMEEKEMEVERLRSENESLKSDLGFDHSELLFLELQLKSLEVECEDSMYHPKLERLQRQMENWRDDWRDVEARFKKRRARYGVAGNSDRSIRDSTAGVERDDDDNPQDWKVDIQKQGTKRVNSLTIRRVSRESDSEEQDQERKDSAKEEAPTPTKAHVADLDSTPKPRSSEQQQQRQQKPQHQQLNQKTPTYTSQATQTTPPPSPSVSPVPLAEALGLNGAFSPGVDDCAITTSPSSVADSDEEDEGEEEEEEQTEEVETEKQLQTITPPARDARNEQKRTALRELWSGLTDWAGLGDDDDW